MGGVRVSPAISSNDPRSVNSRSTAMTAPVQAAVAVVRRLSRPPVMHLKTSSVGFAIWWLVLILHAANVGYFATAAALYHAMRWSNATFQFETYSIGISPTQYYTVAKIHWIVAALHALFMLAMIIGSLQARRLVFLPTSPLWLARIPAQVPSITVKTAVSIPQNQPPSSIRDILASLTRRLSSFSGQCVVVTNSIFGRKGILGVDGVYFDHLLLARELLETTLQTIQCYRMSYLLPRVWLIRFYVALLVANCWSTPIVHRYYGNRHVERRMMCLLCDAVLDVASSIGVSFWIFATYVPQYTDPAFGFPFNNWFDDVWFTVMQQEFQIMLVVSWADMASRLVFAVGLLQCMKSIKSLLSSPAKTESGLLADDTLAAADNNASLVMDRANQAHLIIGKHDMSRAQHRTVGPSKVAADLETHPQADTSWWNRVINYLLETVGPAFFIVVGFAILVVHIVSETRQLSAQVPCQVKLQPWFVSKPACGLVELDCHQLGGLSGTQGSMAYAWTTHDFGVTTRLLVRHCPQLEVPATLQQHDQLRGLKVYNSTIAAWPVEAALTATFHAKMRAVFAVRTKFSNGELPPGLLTTEFPQGLRSFTSSTTNIQSLPDNLHELWPQTMTLAFERSLLQVVPLTLTKMNPVLMSFAGSPIVTVPAEMFEGPQLECVLLSYTLLQELPRGVANPSPSFYLMLLDSTNVSTFWSWMEPFVQYSFSLKSNFFAAQGSRFCAERDEIVAGNRTSFSITTTKPGAHDLASVMDVSTPEKLEFSIAAVLCAHAYQYPFYFPLDLQDAASAVGS